MKNSPTASPSISPNLQSSTPTSENHLDPHSSKQPIMAMKVSLFEHGQKRALDSGAIKPVPQDLEALEEHARAMAREVYREAYDPTLHAHDKFREQEHTERVEERTQLKHKHQLALVEQQKREDDYARHLGLGPKPRPSIFLMIAGVVVLALTILPTLHDYIFVMDRDSYAWLASLAACLAIGTFIVWAIVGAIEETGERSALNIGGLIAAIVLSLGLAILRLMGSEDAGSYFMTFALTLIEIGTVCLIEWYARGVRRQVAQWTEDKRQHDKVLGLLDAIHQEVARLKAGLTELKSDIDAHGEHLEDRAPPQPQRG